MRNISVALVLLFTVVLAAGAAQPMTILGDWEGAIETPAGDMPVTLHVTRSKDGKFGGSIDSPEQGAMGLPITSLTVKNADLFFEVKSVGGTYNGKVSPDKKAIAGTWKGVMGAMPLKFKRPAKPAASK